MSRDLLTLDELTEAEILDTLKKRFEGDHFYTCIGPILLVVNPCKSIKDLYGIRNYYKNANVDPHIFDPAKDAYEGMVTDKKSQSILISGESGAGKTEATKQIIRFLSYASMSQREKMSTLKLGNQHSILERKILAADPILESFGNAKTFRNHNSSRFGKFIKVHFDQSARMVGATISNYLLEKSRIISPPTKERNYHIFYQFIRGSTEREKKLYKLLNTVDNYTYLSQSGCTKIDGVDDAENFTIVKEAMKSLGMNEGTQVHIFKILSAVLLIGNIKFEKSDGASEIQEESYETLENVSILLGINSRDLSEGLVKKKLARGGQFGSVFESRVSVETSITYRDSLAKTLYNSLFNKLVEYINKCIIEDESVLRGTKFIGVLDIFGFETFQENKFEQLLINFTNESLHLVFNQQLFSILQEEYVQEGISSPSVQYKDNSGCVDMFNRKSGGIIPLLDEECHVPRGSDSNFMLKLQSNLGKDPYFSKTSRMSEDQFAVKHYAEDVKYTSKKFITKNRDEVPKYLVNLMQASNYAFVKDLFEGVITESNGRQLRKTVATRFQRQLDDLMDIFKISSLHFVRCFKPNKKIYPDVFESDLMTSQLKYSGVMETAKQRKFGYPIRDTFEDFFNRYSVFLPEQDAKEGAKSVEEYARKCRQILEVSGVDQSLYAIGKEKIFQKDQLVPFLEKKRMQVVMPSIERIQRVFRGHLARRSTRELKKEKEEFRRKEEEARIAKEKEEEKERERQRQREREEEVAIDKEVHIVNFDEDDLSSESSEEPVREKEKRGNLINRVFTMRLHSKREPPSAPQEAAGENVQPTPRELSIDKGLALERVKTQLEIGMDDGSESTDIDDGDLDMEITGDGLRETLSKVEINEAKELVEDLKIASDMNNDLGRSKKLNRFLSRTISNTLLSDKGGDGEMERVSTSIHVGARNDFEETNLLAKKPKEGVMGMMTSVRQNVKHYNKYLKRNKTLININTNLIEPTILNDTNDEAYLKHKLRQDNITGREMDEIIIENVTMAQSGRTTKQGTMRDSLVTRRKKYEERAESIAKKSDGLDRKERIKEAASEIKKILGGDFVRFQKLGELYSSVVYGLFWYVVVFIHSCLLFIEPVSYGDLQGQGYFERNVLLSIELVLCLIYVCYILFEWVIFGNAYWKRIPNCLTAAIVLSIVLDVLLCWGFSLADIYLIRFSRPFRLILVITHSKTLEDITSTIIRTSPKVLEVCILVFGFMALYASVGNLLFRECSLGDDVTYVTSFRDFTSSFMTLYVLLSGENFPKIMLCPYSLSKLYSVYFISYLVIELYLILSVVVAVIVDSFKEYRKNLVLRRRFNQRTELIGVFEFVSMIGLDGNAYMDWGIFDQLMVAIGNPYKRDKHLRTLLFEMVDRQGNGRLYILDFLHLCDVLKIRIRKAKSIRSDIIVNSVYNFLSPIVEQIIYLMVSVTASAITSSMELVAKLFALIRGKRLSKKIEPEDVATARATSGNKPFVDMYADDMSTRSRILFRNINFNFISIYLDIFVVLAVLGNVLMLATFSHYFEEWGSPGKFFNVIAADTIYLLIFWVEIVLRLMTVGFVKSLTDRWYISTVIFLVISSCFSFVLLYTHILSLFSSTDKVVVFQMRNLALGISSFRLLRIIPVFKRLRQVTGTILSILPLFLQIAFLLLGLFYFYTVVGMELFAHKFVPVDEVTHFNNALSAMFTIFQLLIEEDWDVIINAAISSVNYFVSIYFFSFFVLVDILILNLMIGIIIETFQFKREERESEEVSVQETQLRLKKRRYKFFKAYEEGLIDQAEEEEQIKDYLKNSEKFNNFMMKGPAENTRDVDLEDDI